MWVKLGVIIAYSLALIVGTWEVQNWRWEAKQLAAVQVSEAFHTGEEKIGNAADTKFQIEKGKTDATFKKIDDQISKQPGKLTVLCFDAGSLQLLNSALARKTPSSGRPANSMPASATSK